MKELTVSWVDWTKETQEGIVVGFLPGVISDRDYVIILQGSELIKVYLKDVTVSKYGNKKI